LRDICIVTLVPRVNKLIISVLWVQHYIEIISLIFTLFFIE